jgi:flagellar assembly protein FliH
MSSSTEVHGRVRVMRGAAVQAAPALQDLDALTDAERAVADPAALAEALAAGYEDGRGEGFARGHEEGRQAALAEATRQQAEQANAVQAALDALSAAAADVLARRDDAVAALEDALVAGALELAEAVVGRELEVARTPGRDALVRALRLADGTEGVVARLHPEDVETLGDHADLVVGRELAIVTDHTVERGGCIAQVGDGRIDARLSAALARVREVLSS